MAMATMGLRANAEELARDALHANNITPSIVQQAVITWGAIGSGDGKIQDARKLYT